MSSKSRRRTPPPSKKGYGPFFAGPRPPTPAIWVAVAVLLAALAVLLTVPSVRRLAGIRKPSLPPLNILLVTVDTLRPDAMGAYGAEQKSPRMDALAARGTRFVNARTPVPLTLPAHTTMMTGLPPGRHGVRTNTASRVPPIAPAVDQA